MANITYGEQILKVGIVGLIIVGYHRVKRNIGRLVIFGSI